MSVQVLYFAALKDFTRLDQQQIPLAELGDQATPTAVRRFIKSAFPSAADLVDVCLVAVNQCYVGEEEVKLRDGDEVALIPPVSGG